MTQKKKKTPPDEATQERVQKAIEDIMGTTSMSLNFHLDSLIITPRSAEVTFDKLFKLSKLLGTKNINVGAEIRRGGYCDTCGYSYTVSVLNVHGIDVNKLDFSAVEALPDND